MKIPNEKLVRSPIIEVIPEMNMITKSNSNTYGGNGSTILSGYKIPLIRMRGSYSLSDTMDNAFMRLSASQNRQNKNTETEMIRIIARLKQGMFLNQKLFQ